MPHLLEVGLKREVATEDAGTFPFSVPIIRTLSRLDLDVPVTLFVGENGSGKSTLLEGIAGAADLPTLGASDLHTDITLAHQRRLAGALRLAWRPRSRQGFFMRAEDFFGHLRRQARTEARIVREKCEMWGLAPREVDADGPGGLHVDERGAAAFIERFDARSHGESFLELFEQRVRPRGLYLLDEPEAPLSPIRQLALLKLILGAGDAGAQFVIATHSPILLACPGARIYAFDSAPIREVTYEDLEHVHVMRDFLNNPAVYLRHLR
jgi:predicted ATPase